MNATAARPISQDGAHWYTMDGEPMHAVISKSTGLPRPTTLADARKLNLVPSVTTILKVLHKQALVDWMVEQAVLAVLTTPRKPDEDLGQFVQRVMHTERVQEEEATKARSLGVDMHAGMEALFRGERIDDELRPWIEPAYKFVCEHWTMLDTETVVVGNGYAGRIDYIGKGAECNVIIDFKTTKRLPDKGSWPEHRLQLAAYARAKLGAFGWAGDIRTGNLYISTQDCGKFVYHENPAWVDDYCAGFEPLVKHWQWSNGYSRPKSATATSVIGGLMPGACGGCLGVGEQACQ